MMAPKLEIDDVAAWITLDDGHLNVLSTPVLQAISDCLNQAEAADRCVVLKGRTGIFSAGFDMKTFGRSQQASLDMLSAGIDLILKCLSFPMPIITLCTGHAYPMGAFLLMSSDYRIGVAGDWNIGMNEVAVKIPVPPFALALAAHRLSRPGYSHIATATMANPDLAVAHGYLDEVVEQAQLMERTECLLDRLSQLDVPSYVTTKRAMNHRVIDEIAKERSNFPGLNQ